MTGTELITGITKTLISKAAGTLFSEYQARRAEAATNILFSKVSAGELDMLLAAQEDETIGVIYQYMQCAARGTARLNLNLLAQAIKGDIDKGQLYPDNFTKHLNILASLTYNEIFIIGRYWNHLKDVEDLAKSDNKLHLAGISETAFTNLQNELIPSHFETKEHFTALLTSLSRTGLVVGQTTWDTISFEPSVLLREMCQFVNFERALEEEKEY